MNVAIESLEGRTLFAAGGGTALLARAAALAYNPAVQATLALVRADGVAIESARQQIRSESTESRPAVQDVIRAGVETIVADLKAIRDSKDDPDALVAAKAKLKADRQKLRDDVAAAREELRADKGDGREDLQDALVSLRQHLKQLRSDVRNTGRATTTSLVVTGSTVRIYDSSPTLPASPGQPTWTPLHGDALRDALAAAESGEFKGVGIAWG